MALILVARAAYGLQFQAVPAMQPLLARDLDIAFGELGALIGLYMLPGIVVALPAGLLGRRFGDRRVALVGLATMIAGGCLMLTARDLTGLMAGQFVSGVGAIVMGVLTSKMTADWFAGRDLPLGMGVMLNGFPVGMAMAQIAWPSLAQSWGWHAAFGAAIVACALAMLALGPFYRRHPNDRPVAVGAAAPAGLSRFELKAVSVAGLLWATYNGCYIVMTGFTAAYLASTGFEPRVAGGIAGAATLVSAGGVVCGGVLARRIARQDLFVASTLVGWAAILLLAPIVAPAPLLVLGGFVGGLPAGVISAMPGQVLRPGTRGPGLGVFYVWLYVGFAVTPPFAGWVADRLARPEAPLWTGAALLLLALPMLWWFAVLRRRSAMVA